MAKRLVKLGVTVIRDGNRVRPTVGKEFDFTKAEIDGLKDSGALAMPSKDDADEDTTTTAPSSAQSSQAKARGGKKAATANKSDGEIADETDDETDPTDPPEGEGGGDGAGSDDDL